MPPRQPLKLHKPTPKAKPPRGKVGADALASLADELRLPTGLPTPGKRLSGPSGFSPYPDLTMAISMLAKRQQAVAADTERAKLISRWLSQLQSLQTEMQKLHKLEGLAHKLGRN
jgi:hypothetical protein